MIFVTVGTHEQQFNRLIECVDRLKEKRVIEEDVVIQTGFSTYEPKCCVWRKFFPYQDMCKYVNEARIVITHGGPSSFIMPLQVGKIPIVVPRQKQFGEHVNDHQVDFLRAVAARNENVFVVEDISCMQEAILNYDAAVAKRSVTLSGNNARFNERFEKIVCEMLKK